MDGVIDVNVASFYELLRASQDKYVASDRYLWRRNLSYDTTSKQESIDNHLLLKGTIILRKGLITMSNVREREAEDSYEAQNDPSPVSGRVIDDSYAYSETQSGLRNQVPVQRDEDDYEDPVQPPYSNSNEQLGMYCTCTK